MGVSVTLSGLCIIAVLPHILDYVLPHMLEPHRHHCVVVLEQDTFILA